MSDLLVERQGGVLVLTLNRPDARNAMTQSLAVEMAKALDELNQDPVLRIGIVTGAGGNFCSGMDLKAFLRGELPRVEGRGFGALTQARPAKPILAAVEGYALAGGFEMVLACDLIFASVDAKFGLPEVRRGLVPNAGGLMRLPRRIPYHLAMHYILSGELMPAARAMEIGLVNELSAPGQSLQSALRFAERLLENGPLALAAAKRVVSESQDWTEAEMFDLQKKITASVFESEDAKEGARAFAEKRAPIWQGR